MTITITTPLISVQGFDRIVTTELGGVVTNDLGNLITVD